MNGLDNGYQGFAIIKSRIVPDNLSGPFADSFHGHQRLFHLAVVVHGLDLAQVGKAHIAVYVLSG